MGDLKKFKETPAFKWVAGLIGALLISGFGSGIWEWGLSPAFKWVSLVTLSALAYIFHGYANLLHRHIGEARSDIYSELIFALGTGILIGIGWGAVVSYKGKVSAGEKALDEVESKLKSGQAEEKKTPQEVIADARASIRKAKRFNVLQQFIPLIVITILWIVLAMRFVYLRNAQVFVERSIEILTPELDTKTALQLRADYRSVENAEEFYRLYDRLIALANEKHVKLPAFTPVRPGQ